MFVVPSQSPAPLLSALTVVVLREYRGGGSLLSCCGVNTTQNLQSRPSILLPVSRHVAPIFILVFPTLSSRDRAALLGLEQPRRADFNVVLMALFVESISFKNRASQPSPSVDHARRSSYPFTLLYYVRNFHGAAIFLRSFRCSAVV